MTGVVAIPTGPDGRVRRLLTTCCSSHTPGPLGACCDRDDCGPCCAECPTCPRCRFFERFQPGCGRQAVRDNQRFWAEFWGDRLALAEIAAAMEYWDRANFRHTAIRPQIALIVRTVRAVRRTVWGQVFEEA